MSLDGNTPAPLLVADIGGTWARFALAMTAANGRVSLRHEAQIACDSIADPTQALANYVQAAPVQPEAAVLALAGPVRQDAGGEQTLRFTNRPWQLNSADVRRHLQLRQVLLCNDFAALARSVPALPSHSRMPLHPGQIDFAAPVLVAGAGTGFGTATLLPDTRGGWRVLPGEGGHSRWTPCTEIERALWLSLGEADGEDRADGEDSADGFVAVERVAAGVGLQDVHRALCAHLGTEWQPMSASDIDARAAAGDAVCAELCALRAGAILGAVGDMALTLGAQGGVVLAGGASRALQFWLQKPQALRRYLNRGAYSDYLASIPVQLLLQTDAALLGAALYFADRRAL